MNPLAPSKTLALGASTLTLRLDHRAMRAIDCALDVDLLNGGMLDALSLHDCARVLVAMADDSVSVDAVSADLVKHPDSAQAAVDAITECFVALGGSGRKRSASQGDTVRNASDTERLTWPDYWAHCTHTLGMSSVEFWGATPEQVNALQDKWLWEQRILDTRSGMIAMMLYNSNRRKGSRAYRISDFYLFKDRKTGGSVRDAVRVFDEFASMFGARDLRSEEKKAAASKAIADLIAKENGDAS